MPLQSHNLTSYFVVLKEKANKSNKFAVCRLCIENLGYDKACQDSKITNKKRGCKVAHLKNCEFFKISIQIMNTIKIISQKNIVIIIL